jgi:NAD(P)-dependent dehydrogenase (short-subunit alcohol dehydrogenase family)
MKLTNKAALITGGNSGIGFATARLFVAVTPGATRAPIWSLVVPVEDAVRELEQRVSQAISLGRFSEADIRREPDEIFELNLW